MDKNTLSNYGWIVIAVLVLSVMIALATPFGQYVEQGVRSTTTGLFDTSEKAMNVVGMSANKDDKIESIKNISEINLSQHTYNFNEGYITYDGDKNINNILQPKDCILKIRVYTNESADDAGKTMSGEYEFITQTGIQSETILKKYAKIVAYDSNNIYQGECILIDWFYTSRPYIS